MTDAAEEVAAARLLKCILLIERLKREHLALRKIASELEVHHRTARRYIRLIEVAGIPINKDIEKRYFIQPNSITT